MDEMNRRIEVYVEKFLHKSPVEAAAIRRDFRDRHGSTLRGLMVENRADPDDFLDRIHAGLPGAHLLPDPVLQRALASLPPPVHIFTNAPAAYARRALEALGVSSCIDRVFDIAFTQYVGKPDLTAYRAVEKELSAAPGDCLLLDDSLANVEGARKALWRSVWVSHGAPALGVDHVETASELPEYLAAAGFLATP
jgi:putative hydrolase of the HAD superfamily